VFAYSNEISAWIDSTRGSNFATTPQASAASQPPPRGHWRLRYASLFAGFAFALLAVASLLSLLMPHAVTKVMEVASTDAKATELYRSSLHEWQSRTPSGLKRAIHDLKTAIGRDPHFAPAYAALASAYDIQHEFSKDTPESLYPLAIQNAQRAIELDPDLAEAHTALAFAEFYGARQPKKALSEFERALSLAPRDARAHHWYATALLALGDFRRAVSEIETARTLDPESIAIPADRALILLHANRTDEARRSLVQLEADNPLFPSVHLYLSDLALARGDYGSYLREATLFSETSNDRIGEALARAGKGKLAAGGSSGMLHAMLSLQQRYFASGKISGFQLARTYALLGDRQNAVRFLEISVARNEPDNIAMKIDPAFADLQTDPRIRPLLAAAGLQPGA
jgi:Flp pilus assembly protein TadD